MQRQNKDSSQKKTHELTSVMAFLAFSSALRAS